MKKMFLALIVLCGFIVPKTSFAVTTDEQNRQILKDAIVGAVTGAVSTEATKDQPGGTAASTTSAVSSETEKHEHWREGHKKNFSEKKRHHHQHDRDDDNGRDRDHYDHDKEATRPHGWDMGKKNSD